MDWANTCVLPDNLDRKQHQNVIAIINDSNKHQEVKIPTRNILDLLLLINPTNENKIHSLPPIGRSDNHFVFAKL